MSDFNDCKRVSFVLANRFIDAPVAQHALKIIPSVIENGVDLATVGQYLGHHDLRITQTIYSHLVVHEIDADQMPAEMGERKRTDKVIPLK